MESNILKNIELKFKWIINKLLCLTLKTGNTNTINGANGSLLVTDEVKWISAYDQHLEFIDSPVNISGIEGHTVIKIKDELIEFLKNPEVVPPDPPILIQTGNTDAIDGSNGTNIISTDVTLISAYEEHLEFTNGTNPGNTVIKIKDSLLDNINTTINNNASKVLLDSQEIKLSWKNGNINYAKTPLEDTTGIKDNIYTRNGFIYDSNNSSGTLPLEIEDINNLVISIPKWNEISAYNPKLIIDRYKPTKKKGDPANPGNIYPGTHYSSAGFKISKSIPLNASLQVIDFNQESYFKVKDWNGTDYNLITFVVPRGIGKRGANRYVRPVDTVSTQFFNARVYLQFRLQITKDNVVYTSKPLNKIKMICSLNIQGTDLVESKIKFKFT